MTIMSSDGRMSIDVGSHTIWRALCSTVHVRLKDQAEKIRPALDLFDHSCCRSKDGIAAARAVNLIRDGLARVKPEEVVFNENDLKQKAPWGNDISPAITSCANYFTTADGGDLLAELVRILTYAFYAGADILIQG